jgi:hypothetical protein
MKSKKIGLNGVIFTGGQKNAPAEHFYFLF